MYTMIYIFSYIFWKKYPILDTCWGSPRLKKSSRWAGFQMKQTNFRPQGPRSNKRAVFISPWLVVWYRGLYYSIIWGLIIIRQYKDPYKPISIMECHKGLFHAAQVPLLTLRCPCHCVWHPGIQQHRYFRTKFRPFHPRCLRWNFDSKAQPKTMGTFNVWLFHVWLHLRKMIPLHQL